MKILLVHYRYFISGGPERYLFNVKKSLEDLGHTVIPFSIKNSKNVENEYSDYFVENIGNSDEVFVNKYPKNLKTYMDLVAREFYSFKVKRKLEKLIKDTKPDVCYLLVYKRALSPSVIDACRKYNLSVVNRISDYNTVCGAGSLYCNGQYCEKCLTAERECLKNKCIKGNTCFSFMRYLSIKLHKIMQMQNKIDTYICTNRFMAEMMERYGYDRDKLKVVPTFFKEDTEIKQWDKSNIVNKNEIQFLFIGNIDESKGIYDLLDALTILQRHRQNFHLYVVGGLHIEENKRVMDIIKNNHLDTFITFVPFMTSREVFQYYLMANVTILPARWVENLPNTLVEALYFNRPVVVPDFGSFQYTTDETVAFRYKALSSSSLADCLIEICERPEQIQKKSDACREFFEKNYSEAVHMECLQQIFEKCNEINK